MILGIDISTHFEEMAANAKYYDKGKEVDPLEMFVENAEYIDKNFKKP